jgi:hypothetical protein
MWEGRPVRHRLFRATDALLVPFTLVWFAFAIFWESRVTARSAPPPLVVFGAVFVAIGVYLVAGRFVLRAIASRRTRYVVTNRRVASIGGVSGHRVQMAYTSALPPPVIAERADGSGSLAFGAFPGLGEAFGTRNGWRAWGAEPSGALVLWDIPDVRHVRDLVVGAQAKA